MSERAPETPPRAPRWRTRVDPRWAPLALLLAALAVAVLTFDRASWPGFAGDEATYLMAAESLAWDGDLLYSRSDYDRFVGHWGRPPDGLILQSGDGGETIAYSKPFFYPLVTAPFVRFAPVRGALIANVVLLALAAVAAARALGATLGRAAPLWVAAFLFASVAFAYAFWAHADAFLLAAAALALAALFGRPAASPAPALLRVFGAGILLGAVVFSRPIYLPLLLPALLALPAGRRKTGAAVLAAGVALVSLAGSGVHRATGGSWTAYGGERRAFYSYTGFPEVDFSAERWEESVRATGSADWGEVRALLAPPVVDAGLTAWNALFFLVGRDVGVLPYFLPLLLGFAARPRGAARWALLAAVALSVAGFFLYRPFNFYGGGGAIANRYFLPLYPAFWFLPSRPARGAWALAAAVLAAPFLWPLWTDPGGFLKRPDGSYRYVSAAAAALLPFESSQSHLQPSQGPDLSFRGLWIRFANAEPRASRGGDTIHLRPGAAAELVLAMPRGERKLDLRLVGEVPERLELEGARFADGGTAGTPRRRTRLLLDPPRARHPTWWSARPRSHFVVGLRFTGAEAEWITFRLAPAGRKLEKTGRTRLDAEGRPPAGALPPDEEQRP